jgi:hypothetical protein
VSRPSNAGHELANRAASETESSPSPIVERGGSVIAHSPVLGFATKPTGAPQPTRRLCRHDTIDSRDRIAETAPARRLPRRTDHSIGSARKPNSIKPNPLPPGLTLIRSYPPRIQPVKQATFTSVTNPLVKLTTIELARGSIPIRLIGRESPEQPRSQASRAPTRGQIPRV